MDMEISGHFGRLNCFSGTHRLHLLSQLDWKDFLKAENSVWSFDHPGVLWQVLRQGQDLRLGAAQGQAAAAAYRSCRCGCQRSSHSCGSNSIRSFHCVVHTQARRRLAKQLLLLKLKRWTATVMSGLIIKYFLCELTFATTKGC